MIISSYFTLCFSSQPKAMIERKKSTGIGNRSHVSFHVSHELKTKSRTDGESSYRALTSEKINNFSEVLLAVYKTSYDDCMKVLWNAVVYEPVADYCIKWRKRKHWSEYATAPSSAAEKDVMSVVDVQKDNGKLDSVCFFSLLSSGLFCSFDLLLSNFCSSLVYSYQIITVFQVVVEPQEHSDHDPEFPPGFMHKDETQTDVNGTSDFVCT